MKIRDREDFQKHLAKTYWCLRNEGEITLSPDNMGCTDELERLWVNMLQFFPCTQNDVHRALINLRKHCKLKDEGESSLQHHDDSTDESIEGYLFCYSSEDSESITE